MPTDETLPYQIKPGASGWEVLDDSGRVVMKCRDERSATDYAVLLNEAYRRGYKAGWRGAGAIARMNVFAWKRS
jgi:hypothetical protein